MLRPNKIVVSFFRCFMSTSFYSFNLLLTLRLNHIMTFFHICIYTVIYFPLILPWSVTTVTLPSSPFTTSLNLWNKIYDELRKLVLHKYLINTLIFWVQLFDISDNLVRRPLCVALTVHFLNVKVVSYFYYIMILLTVIRVLLLYLLCRLNTSRTILLPVKICVMYVSK